MRTEERFVEMASTRPRCFWLDAGPGNTRRSIMGALRDDDVSLTYDATRGEVLRHRGEEVRPVGTDIFAVLEDELARTPPDEIWVGFFGYACRPDLPARKSRTDDPAMPDAVWMRTRRTTGFDRSAAPGAVRHRATRSVAETPAAYTRAFDQVQRALRAGNTYEVNLTHRVQVRDDVDPALAYLRLRELNPAPYAGFIQHHDVRLLSSSPERYATIDRDRMIETRPIKGTTPRATCPEEDDELRRDLASNPRFRAENLMIVDLLRNDLAMVCEPGSVTVPSLMAVESYASVHQLVTTVRGRLRDGVTGLEALRALFPAGSMTGAPKLRTMEIIRSVETSPRGVYSGAFGWIAPDGRADLGVVIRSLTTPGDGTWELGTGGGITVHSTAHDEYAESGWKAERLLRVFGTPLPGH
ncbi:anthranilate synthase component 1/para-aminobenzoate synthetase [Nocardioides sp. YR527]|uniref:anthranilate synthase component I family protein n=1 Tax=Nocardioides sp. YR527 TaxID=1881028 RepID=UPI00088A7151|nr:anthranilate synthase component I family protein [Nocardioides sp. YR527]SDK67166.1 anthranilate synthase component 1/para-aminobenzoate synthetase [Nocardioides sp. YR527]